MATRKLYIDANTGVMLIANQSLTIDSNVKNSPTCFANDLYFHSKFDYIQIKGKLTPSTTLTFPSLAMELITWSDGSKGCGGGCFITEACVESLGLADNCYELTTLRNFRDSYMLANAETLIDEYYDNAPKVVAFIKAQGKSQSKAIFTKLYNEYIIPSVGAIERGKLQEALDLYKTGCYEAQRLAGL